MADGLPEIDWREHSVKIVRAGQLDSNTPETLGMNRSAAITRARTGANKLWAGTVTIHADFPGSSRLTNHTLFPFMQKSGIRLSISGGR